MGSIIILMLIILPLMPTFGDVRDGNVAGGFGDLEISPTLLTGVDFGNVHLPVWEHRKNSERQANQRQYFTLPLVRIVPGSATCVHNILTNAAIAHFDVLMWSSDAENAVISQLRDLTKIEGLASSQLSIIPMERIRFVWKTNLVPLSDQFLLDDAWRSYALKTKTVRPAVHAADLSSCEKLRDSIRMQPIILDNLELQFIIQAKKSFQTKLKIKGHHFANNPILERIRTVARSDGTAILQAADLTMMSTEAVSSFMAKRETDAGYIDSGDSLSLQKHLASALKKHSVLSTEMPSGHWTIVYWTPKIARPDLITEALSTVFQKSSKGSHEITINSTCYNKLVNQLFGATGLLERQKLRTNAIDDITLAEWLLKNKIQSSWTGNNFVIKAMKLYRININSLLSRQEIVTTDVQVHSSEHIYSIKPIIPSIVPNTNVTATASIPAVNYKVEKLDNLVKVLDQSVDRKLELIVQKMNTIDKSVNSVDNKMNTIDKSVNSVDNKVTDIGKDMADPLRKLRESDIIAQAACSTMSTGWTYALRRNCTVAPSCQTLCTKEPFISSDPQTKGKKRGCAGSLHVYGTSNTIPRDSEALSTGNLGAYKVYNYGSCAHTVCGPNYCCCTAKYQ